jgi:hypothetical protein
MPPHSTAATHRPATTRRNKREDLISQHSFPFSKGDLWLQYIAARQKKQENCHETLCR